MRALRLYAVIVLSAVAVLAVVVGGPVAFRLIAVGAFVVLAPGLLLTQLLRVADQLLSLVITLVTGPAVWIMIATVATFAHLWWPAPTVVVAAALLGGACLALLPAALRVSDDPLHDVRHRFAAHLHDDLLLKPVGRHRGAFPSPYHRD